MLFVWYYMHKVLEQIFPFVVIFENGLNLSLRPVGFQSFRCDDHTAIDIRVKVVKPTVLYLQQD